MPSEFNDAAGGVLSVEGPTGMEGWVGVEGSSDVEGAGTTGDLAVEGMVVDSPESIEGRALGESNCLLRPMPG